jgi:hypothetical protein
MKSRSDLKNAEVGLSAIGLHDPVPEKQRFFLGRSAVITDTIFARFVSNLAKVSYPRR